MENKNIGQAGNSINGTYATCSMNKKPDGEHMKLYDEYEYEAKNPIVLILTIVDILFLASSIYLFYSGHWIWGAIVTLVFIFLMLLTFSISRIGLNKEMAYENGLLIPAILFNTKPIELVVIADMSTKENQDPIYGCLKMKLKNLPNHKLELNEQVPCVSLFGMGVSKGYRKHFEPRPVSWGYQNKEDIEKALKAIEDEEWELLDIIAPKMKDVKEYNEPRFFDKKGNLITL